MSTELRGSPQLGLCLLPGHPRLPGPAVRHPLTPPPRCYSPCSSWGIPEGLPSRQEVQVGTATSTGGGLGRDSLCKEPAKCYRNIRRDES